MKKEIGYIGLGKMGKNMVFRLLERGWKVVAFNRSPESVKEVADKGAVGVGSIKEMVSKLSSPKVVWLMVLQEATDEMINNLASLLERGDVIIDGGNSPYLETIRRARELSAKGIEFLDVGVSGGPSGVRNGACMMAGGKKEIFEYVSGSGIFKDMCVEGGSGYVGPSGAGHYVKMVHNGIEYGMMQSIAEGFDLMRHTKDFGKELDLEKITDIYSHGSVITSRLISWMGSGYKKFGKDLKEISGKAGALGEGQWTYEAGVRDEVPMPAIKAALDVRAQSQKKPSYQGKVISTLRGEFGGHKVNRDPSEPEIL